jgi:hypothetical protein
MKLHSLWDLIILGNITNLGIEIEETLKSIEDTDKECQHVLKQFPNCRFVFKFYSTFQLKICANRDKFQELNEQVLLMRQGTIIIPDDAHVFGMTRFPNLPTTLRSKDDTFNHLFHDEESQYDDRIENDSESKPIDVQISENHYNSLKDKILHIVFPGIKFRQITIIVIFVFGFLIPFFILLFLFSSTQIDSEEPLRFLQTIGMTHFLIHCVPSFS